jgi:hypothetical protein
VSDVEPTLPLPPLDGWQPPAPPPPAPPPTRPASWLTDPWNPTQQRYWDGQAWTGHTAPVQQSRSLAPYQPSGVQPYPAYAQPLVPAYGYPRPATVVMSDANPNGVHITLAWIFTVLTLGYLLPWAIAATRGKSNALAIGLLNFLLGWTFLGWLAALVMACGSHQTYAVVR